MRKRGGFKFYFAFRSPYSWLAIEKLRRHNNNIFESMDLIPYWEPDTITESLIQDLGGRHLYTVMSKEKHRYILSDIKRLTQEMDLQISWPIDRNVWWEVPHLAFLVARHHGKARDFLFRASEERWVNGCDICSESVIGDIAKDLCLPIDDVLGAPSSTVVRREGADCLYQAYRDDVFGVPYIKYNAQRYWGFDRVSYLLRDLEVLNRVNN